MAALAHASIGPLILKSNVLRSELSSTSTVEIIFKFEDVTKIKLFMFAFKASAISRINQKSICQ